MTLAKVDAFVTDQPGVTVGARWNNKTWFVNEHAFAWSRPLSKADLARFAAAGAIAPIGEILAVHVESLDAKDAILSMELPGFFTIEHFANYPAVLIALKLARVKDVRTSILVAFGTAAAKRPKQPPAKRRPRPDHRRSR
ncbi:hypothetical protein BH11MYX1_BH11MYX1_39250 [soil metagenome]